MTGKSQAGFTLYAWIALMVLFWSGNYIIGKIALRELPAVLLTCFRITLAGVILLPLYLWKRDPVSRRDLPILLWLGIFGVTLNQLFFVMGLGRTSVAHSSIIIGMTPICVLLIAAAFGLERLTALKLAGMGIALAGVAILQLGTGRSGRSQATLLGDALTLCASLTFAMFTVMGKRVSLRYSGLTVNTFAYVGGAITLAPVTLWNANHTPLTHISAAAWASVFYMAAFPSVAAYLIYYYALTRIPASRVSGFSYFQPLLATLMAAFWLNEGITGSVVAGGMTIMAGVYLTEASAEAV